MKKTIYHYNAYQHNVYTETEVLEGLVLADLLIPAHATELAPPTSGLPISHVWCFHGEKWVATCDYRTKTIHNPDTREEKIADMVGALPTGFVLGKLPPKELTLEEEIDAKIEVITYNAYQALKQGVAIEINGCMQCFPCTEFMRLLPAKTQYLETSDGYEEFTAEQIKTLITPAIKNYTHKVKLWQYATIKTIKEATTVSEVKAISTTMV